MNAMFLEMVGADPAAMSGDKGDHRSQVFRSAEITSQLSDRRQQR